jgi:hypothetical protein
LSDSIGVVTAVRAAIAFLALIVPTALMGRRFRWSCAPLRRRRAASGSRRVLYGSNAAGAIAGTLYTRCNQAIAHGVAKAVMPMRISPAANQRSGDLTRSPSSAAAMLPSARPAMKVATRCSRHMS